MLAGGSLDAEGEPLRRPGGDENRTRSRKLQIKIQRNTKYNTASHLAGGQAGRQAGCAGKSTVRLDRPQAALGD